MHCLYDSSEFKAFLVLMHCPLEVILHFNIFILLGFAVLIVLGKVWSVLEEHIRTELSPLTSRQTLKISIN